jgi:hypothetical protein
MMELLGDVVMRNLISACLEMVLVLVQDRSTVCAERTIGSKIILDALDGTLGHVGHVKSRFDPFGDVLVLVQVGCMVCAKRTIGLEIVLDAPDGTPR